MSRNSSISLALQKWYYGAHIKEQQQWEFAGIYEDIGSGTQIKGRLGFQQMMEDCDAGKIDLIITKSIFRFSRNTLESLKATRNCKFRRNSAINIKKRGRI